MPCYRCGVRQTDPVRGPSLWKRGVRGGVQVLVCPDCQRAHDWPADLDRCGACGSTMLVRILGETQCRSCGASGDEAAPPVAAAPGSAARPVLAATPGSATPTAVAAAAAVGGAAASAPAAAVPPLPPPSGGRSNDLAREVEAALDRLFGRA
jgi:hypothetical protein